MCRHGCYTLEMLPNKGQGQTSMMLMEMQYQVSDSRCQVFISNSASDAGNPCPQIKYATNTDKVNAKYGQMTEGDFDSHTATSDLAANAHSAAPCILIRVNEAILIYSSADCFATTLWLEQNAYLHDMFTRKLVIHGLGSADCA